jgi:hypothetical protein
MQVARFPTTTNATVVTHVTHLPDIAGAFPQFASGLANQKLGNIRLFALLTIANFSVRQFLHPGSIEAR